MLLKRFVGSPPGALNMERKLKFETVGSLLDPESANATAIGELLQEAQAVCEFAVRVCASELETMSLSYDPEGEGNPITQCALHLSSLSDLRARSIRFAADLRARGRCKEASRLDRVGSTADFVQASAEHLRQLEGELLSIKSGLGRRSI